jgi:uncharacterized protein (DUF3820 family)
MTQMPFGRYSKGTDIRELDACPSDYIIWMQEQEWFEEKFPQLAEEATEIMAEREESGTHWNKWEEEMSMSEVIYGKGKPFV